MTKPNKMTPPLKELSEELLKKIHVEGIPNWTTEEQQLAYEQFKNLFEHWFRKEL